MVMVQTSTNTCFSMERQAATEYVYRFSDELGQHRAGLDGTPQPGCHGHPGHRHHDGGHALFGHDHQAADQPVNIEP